jgi:hypothetical protein
MPVKKYQANPPIVRLLLRQFEDGLSPKEMAEKTGIDQDALYRVLKKMPDVYIDRWTFPRGSGHPTAIWCVVDVPKNCPKPRKRKEPI